MLSELITDMTAPQKSRVMITTWWLVAVQVINPASSMLLDGTWQNTHPISFEVVLITLMYVQVLLFWRVWF